MKYTMFYTPAIEQNGVMGAVFNLDDFEAVMADHPEARARGGMMLLQDDYEGVTITPEHGKAWLRIDRGCSWLHTQGGYICAGAGGLNSTRVRELV